MPLDKHRDPAARTRFVGGLLAVAILWPLFKSAEVSFDDLFNIRSLKVIGNFLAAFLPPETGAEFVRLLGKATLQTLAIATAGIALASVLAVPLSYFASAAAREKPTFNPLLRALLTILRGIPELVWALIFVRVFGLGPTAGILALGLTYGGMLAKVYAEILESVDDAPAHALRQAGATRPLVILYGLLPQASKELTSYTVYRWECAVRASVVMGFVGAGGLGQLMDQAMKMLNGGEAASILLTFMALVLAADALSGLLRRAIDTPPANRTSALNWRSMIIGMTLCTSVISSFKMLEINFMALMTVEAAHNIGKFIAEFLHPDRSTVWLIKVGKGIWETLAISVVGTLLAAITALLLALPRRRAPFTFLFNMLRSVPELVWATITALAVGLGPFAGAMALALHTAGVLGRLYAEALDNTPAHPRVALRMAGANSYMAFLYGTLPAVATQLIAYTLYRWEMNVRMASILGFVGAGGLGQLLYLELSLFHHARASTVIIAMLLVSLLVDQSSVLLRRRMR